MQKLREKIRKICLHGPVPELFGQVSSLCTQFEMEFGCNLLTGVASFILCTVRALSERKKLSSESITCLNVNLKTNINSTKSPYLVCSVHRTLRSVSYFLLHWVCMARQVKVEELAPKVKLTNKMVVICSLDL